MEELVRYDPHLVVGILGGSAGTTRDAFQMLADAQKYGAKVALYGRKINNAENQLAFIQFLRLIVDGCHSARGGGQGLSRRARQTRDQAPKRTLEEDLTLQSAAMSYGGTKTVVTVPDSPESRSLPEARSPRLQVVTIMSRSPVTDRSPSPPGTAFPAPSTAAPTSPGWTSPSAWRTIGTGSALADEPIGSTGDIPLARLELRGVEKTYPGGIVAARGVDLTVEDGELFVIVGPSGSGKSTLLRLVAGLETLESGSVWLDGRRIDALAPRDRDVAMVFQDQVLYPHLDVFENLAFGLRARGISRREVEDRVRGTSSVLGLSGLPRPTAGNALRRPAEEGRSGTCPGAPAQAVPFRRTVLGPRRPPSSLNPG